MSKTDSYFDGNTFEWIGYKILSFFICLVTLGLAYPWMVCMVYGWQTKHTYLNGKRLKFDGTGMQLFGTWIKWWFLCIITFGIYSLFMHVDLMKWKTKHTRIVGE